MSQNGNKKQPTLHVVKEDPEFDAVTKTLSKLLRKPLLALLDGAEPGEDDVELDRWWTPTKPTNYKISPIVSRDLPNCSICGARNESRHGFIALSF